MTTTQAFHSDVVAAMFEDRAAAEAARDRLEADGIVPGTIDIVDQPVLAQPEAEVHRRSIWERVEAKFGAHPHAHGYAEGVARGHAMLFVRAAPDRQAEVMKILEHRHPIDLMVREEEWAATGWTGTYNPGPTTGAPSEPKLLFADAPYPDHLHATGLINEDDTGSSIGAPLTNPMGIAVSGTPTVRRYT